MVALRDSRETLCGATDGFEVTVIKVADVDAVGEQHSVAQPVETVREHHFAFRARGHAIEFDQDPHRVAQLEVDLTCVWSGE